MRVVSRIVALLLIIVLLVLLSACDLSRMFQPTTILPDSAVYLKDGPPAEVYGWWAKMEQCSGRTRDIGQIDWFLLRNTINFSYGSEPGPLAGVYDDYGSRKDHSRILMADFYLGIEAAWEHEIVHALVRRSGHPPEYFGPDSPCGKLLGSFAVPKP